jgi:hypothetical protein
MKSTLCAEAPLVASQARHSASTGRRCQRNAGGLGHGVLDLITGRLPSRAAASAVKTLPILESPMHVSRLDSCCAALALSFTLLAPAQAQAQQAMAMRTEVLNFLKSKFELHDGKHLMAEIPQLEAAMAPRYGKPNQAGTSESPRVVWILRVPGDTLGNCLRVDARKYNKNDPGLETKLLTGKCEMYQREKLTVNDPAS